MSSAPQDHYIQTITGNDGNEVPHTFHRDPLEWLKDLEEMLKTAETFSSKHGQELAERARRELEKNMIDVHESVKRTIEGAFTMLENLSDPESAETVEETLPEKKPEEVVETSESGKTPDFSEAAQAILEHLSSLIETPPQPGNVPSENAISQLWAAIDNLDTNEEISDKEKTALKRRIYIKRLDFLNTWARIDKNNNELTLAEKQMISKEAKRVIHVIDLDNDTDIGQRIGAIRIHVGREMLQRMPAADTVHASKGAPTAGATADTVADTVLGATPATPEDTPSWKEMLEEAHAYLSNKETVWDQSYATTVEEGLNSFRASESAVNTEKSDLADQVERLLNTKRLDYLLDWVKHASDENIAAKASAIQAEVADLQKRFSESSDIVIGAGHVEFALKIRRYKSWLEGQKEALLVSAEPLHHDYAKGFLGALASIKQEFKEDKDMMELAKEAEAALHIRQKAIALETLRKNAANPRAIWTEDQATTILSTVDDAKNEFPASNLIQVLAAEINIELHARKLDSVFREIRSAPMIPPAKERENAERREAEIRAVERLFPTNIDRISRRTGQIRQASKDRLESNEVYWKAKLEQLANRATDTSEALDNEKISKLLSELSYLKEQFEGLDELINLAEIAEKALCIRALNDRLTWIDTQDQSTVEDEEDAIRQQLAAIRTAGGGDAEVEARATAVEQAIERKKEAPEQTMRRELTQALISHSENNPERVWEKIAEAEAGFAETLKIEIRATKRKLYELDLDDLIAKHIPETGEDDLKADRPRIESLIESINQLFGTDTEMIRKMDAVREAYKLKTDIEIPREDMIAKEAAAKRQRLIDVCNVLETGNIGPHAEAFKTLGKLVALNPETYGASDSGKIRLIQNTIGKSLMGVLAGKGISGDTLAEKHTALLHKSHSDPMILMRIIDDLSKKKVVNTALFKLIETVDQLLQEEDTKREKAEAERVAREKEERVAREEAERLEREVEAEAERVRVEAEREANREPETLTAAELAFNRSIEYLTTVAAGDTGLVDAVKNMGDGVRIVLAGRDRDLIPLAEELRKAVRDFAEPLENAGSPPRFSQNRLIQFLSDNDHSILPLNQVVASAA